MKSFRKAMRVCAITAAVACAAVGAAAADFNYDFTVCTTGRRIPVEATPDVVAFGIESWGVVASSTTKEWERATTHCAGYLRVVGGKLVGKGTCKWTEAGGDSAVGEWEYPATGEPAWVWLGGTGKLKGITGGGTFRELFSAAKTADPAVSHGCRRDWGKYSLP